MILGLLFLFLIQAVLPPMSAWSVSGHHLTSRCLIISMSTIHYTMALWQSQCLLYKHPSLTYRQIRCGINPVRVTNNLTQLRVVQDQSFLQPLLP